jgi:hypothetical protein
MKREINFNLKGRLFMPEYKEASRVLSRVGARELTQGEYEKVDGGIKTIPCTFNPATLSMDGDCPPPIS